MPTSAERTAVSFQLTPGFVVSLAAGLLAAAPDGPTPRQFFAIKRAVAAARADRGITEWFEFDAPATPDRIRAACAVGPIASGNG